MGALGWIIGIFVTLLIIGLIILIVYYTTRRKEQEVPVKSPITVNFASEKFGGHAIFVETNSYPALQNANNIYIEGKPLDVAYDSKGNPIMPQSRDISVKRNMIEAIPTHALSNFRQINFILTEPENMHPLFRESRIGRALAIIHHTIHEEDTIIEMLKSRQKQTTDIIREMNRGELFTDAIQNMKAMMQDSMAKRLQQEGFQMPRDKQPVV